MKIAVPSQGNSLDSMMDTRFARAKYFIIYDTDKETFEVIDNEQNAAAGGGVGVKVGQDLANMGVNIAIAPHFGPNAEQVLKTANITMKSLSNITVKEAVDAVRQ
ncbi:NifB/NifX family molybdenum-iron cluster-binding protein [bacterium]|nr:NifB/NifX family molybdenum-iron cluster-binding protein [bacterium]